MPRHIEALSAKPDTAERIAAEPDSAGPIGAGQVSGRPVPVRPAGTGPDTARPSGARTNGARLYNAELSSAWPHSAEPVHARSGSAGSNRAGTCSAELNRTRPNNSAPILSVQSLVKHYPVASQGLRRGRLVRAVDGISFDILEGETLGLVGESGCGKSTTAHMIASLVRPTSGAIRYGGKSTAEAKGSEQRALRREIQLVFQDPYASLNPRHRILAVLEEPLRVHRLGDQRTRRKQAEEMLELVGLDASFGRRYAHELSGGQRQRIGIARALMLQPRLIVADEPVSALDVSVQAQILNLLKEMQRKFSLTYLFVSHDLNVVHYMSDRVAVMYLGKIVEIAPVDRIYSSPLHPYTQGLLALIPGKRQESRGGRTASGSGAFSRPLLLGEGLSELPATKEDGPRTFSEETSELMAPRSETTNPTALTGEMPDPVSTPSGCAFHPRCPWAREGCRQAVPPLQEAGDGHYVRCFLP